MRLAGMTGDRASRGCPVYGGEIPVLFTSGLSKSCALPDITPGPFLYVGSTPSLFACATPSRGHRHRSHPLGLESADCAPRTGLLPCRCCPPPTHTHTSGWGRLVASSGRVLSDGVWYNNGMGRGDEGTWSHFPGPAPGAGK